jgi:hypothetical protein
MASPLLPIMAPRTFRSEQNPLHIDELNNPDYQNVKPGRQWYRRLELWIPREAAPHFASLTATQASYLLARRLKDRASS